MKTSPCLTILLLFHLSVFSQEQLILQQGSNGYEGTTDTSIFEDAQSNSLGGSVVILVGSTASSFRRGLVRFDVSDFPQNAVIISAELILFVDAEGAAAQVDDSFQLIPLNKSWGEGNANAGSTSGSGSGFGAVSKDGDATWLSNAHNQSTWLNPGSDFDSSLETS